MKAFDLKYFKDSKSFSVSDFQRPSKTVKINLDRIISITSLEMLHAPFSGTAHGYYSLVNLEGNNTYAINEESYNKLNKAIS